MNEPGVISSVFPGKLQISMIEPVADSIFKQLLPPESLPETLKLQFKLAWKSELPIGLACSGGADSLFLVRWFLSVFREWHSRVILIHFNHKTRGQESDEDACFVSALARKLGVRFEIGTHPDQASEIQKDEHSLREARLAFFETVWIKENLCLILTAHHMEDRVESLLMRLSRGSAMDGLIAPKVLQEFRNGMKMGRPLISLEKSSITLALNRIDQTWREDASNSNENYYRNFIRRRLIPEWEKNRGPSLLKNLSRSLSYLEEDADFLNNFADKQVQSIDLRQMVFPIKQFETTPVTITRRCVWKWLNTQEVSESVSHDQVEHICRMSSGSSVSICKDWKITRNAAGELLLQSVRHLQAFHPQQFTMGSESMICFPDGSILRIEQIVQTADLYQSITEGFDHPTVQIHLDCRVLKGASQLTVKFWADGMAYTPFGFHHNKKLKSCFIDRKIKSELRRRLPVVCNHQGEILWVPGLLPSETGRIEADSKHLLRLTYQKS